MKLPRISHSLGTAFVLVGLVVLSGIAQTATPNRPQASSNQTARKQTNQTLIKSQSSSSTESNYSASRQTKSPATTPVADHSAVTTESDPAADSAATPATTEPADSSTEPADPVKTVSPTPPTDVCSCGGTLYHRCADCLPPQPPVCGVCGAQTGPPHSKQIMCPQYCLTAL